MQMLIIISWREKLGKCWIFFLSQIFCSHFDNEFLKTDSLTLKDCPSCERVWARCTRRWRQNQLIIKPVVGIAIKNMSTAQPVVLLCCQASVMQQKSRMAEMEELLKSEMTNIKGDRRDQSKRVNVQRTTFKMAKGNSLPAPE